MIQFDTFAVKEKTCSVQNEDPSLFLFEANFSFLIEKAMAVNSGQDGATFTRMNERKNFFKFCIRGYPPSKNISDKIHENLFWC